MQFLKFSCIFVFIIFLLNDCKTDSNNLKLQKDTCISAFVLVGTIDGYFHAIEFDSDKVNRLWTVNTGSLLHSSVNKLELYNEDNSLVRIIPSLDGNLYKYFASNEKNQEYIEKIPLNMEELLKKSIKINQEMTFIGGMMTHTFGIDSRNGQVIYNCTSDGCSTFSSNNIKSEGNLDDLIVIKQYKHVLRAVSIYSGHEKWNISLCKNEIILHPKCDYELKSSTNTILNNLYYNLRFEVSKGIISLKNLSFNIGLPIVSCDIIYNGLHRTMNIFKKANIKTNELIDKFTNLNSIYIGKYQSHYYAQSINHFEYLNEEHNVESKQNLANKFEKKFLSTKSTLISLAAAAFPNKYPSKNHNLNKNALILFKENGQSERNNGKLLIDFDDGNEKSSDESESWLFIEEPMTLITINNIQITYGQIISIFLTILTLILTYYFVQRRLCRNKLQASLKLIQEASNSQTSLKAQNSITNSMSDCETQMNHNEPFKSKYLTEYDHIRLIGKGGFGHVFEAKHKIDERTFAIKRIKLRNTDEKDKVSREVRTLAKLENQFIVRYFYSWFEYPPVEWQDNVDRILLRKEKSVDEDYDFSSTSQINSSESNQISSLENSNYPSSYTFSKKFKNTTNNSSSFIVFQNTTSNMVSSQPIPEESIEEDRSSFELCSKEAQENKNNLKPDHYIFLYIQMELCKRETLCNWLNSNSNRSKKDIFKIFEQILNAISYIHSMDLIHRDLKPSNIFLTLNDQIKIGDFGLVVEMKQNEDELMKEKSSKNGSKFKDNDGTFLYMSPEQLTGNEYNHKIDIYSLGIILFELIYSFNTQMERIETLKKLKNHMFPEGFEKKFKIEADLVKILIEDKPDDRPSAEEIVALGAFKKFKKLCLT